jgi:TolA-binding protein
MKRIATKLAVLTAATLISAVPVLAGTEMSPMGMAQGDRIQKDECLLVSQNCRNSVDSIQQRIDKLSREISKGTSVYNQQELRQLEFKLREENQMLSDLTRGGT